MLCRAKVWQLGDPSVLGAAEGYYLAQLACAIEYLLKLDTTAEEAEVAHIASSGLGDILGFIGGSPVSRA